MILPPFLSQNMLSDYPLQGLSQTVSRRWITDIGLIMGVASGYSYESPVNITRVESTNGGGVDVTVSSDVDEGAITYVFHVPHNSRPGTVVRVAASMNADPPSVLIGFGFLQVGDMSDIFVADNDIDVEDAALIPTRVTNLNKHGVRSISVANEQATPLPIGPCDNSEIICGSFDLPYAGEPYYETGTVFLRSTSTLTIDLTNIESITFHGTSDDPAILLPETDAVTQTPPTVSTPTTAVTFEFPATRAIIFRNTHGSMVTRYVNTSKPASAEKTFTNNGPGPAMTYTYPEGAVGLDATGAVVDMEDGGFTTHSWGLKLTKQQLLDKGLAVVDLGVPVLKVRLWHVNSGKGFASLQAMCRTVPGTTALVVVPSPIVGNVLFGGGYFSTADLSPAEKAIGIGVATEPVGGDELPCDLFSKLVYPGVPPVMTDQICVGLIFSINGTSARDDGDFTLQGSQGVSVSRIGEHALKVLIDQRSLFQPLPDPPICPPLPEEPGLCNIITTTDEGAGTNDGFFRTYDLTVALAGGPIEIDFTYQTYMKKDRFVVMAADTTVLFDSGCVGSGGEVTIRRTIDPDMNPISVQVIPNCEGGAGTQWYWRMGCVIPAPDVSANTGCEYSVSLTGSQSDAWDGDYTLVHISGTEWAISPTNKRVRIYFVGNRWWLIFTDYVGSIIFYAPDLGLNRPPDTGWTRVPLPWGITGMNSYTGPVTLDVEGDC